MKENNLIMKSEGNKSNNNDSSFTRNSSSTSQPTTGNKTTFKDWWKYLKWFLIIGIIGLLIFAIWYLSVPHYSIISLNSQGITYGSKIDDKGNKQEWLELHYGKNTANKIIALASSSKTKNKYLLKTMNIINRRIIGTKKNHKPPIMYKYIE